MQCRWFPLTGLPFTLALLLSLVPKGQQGLGAENQPNVLMISIDDLNDWTSCLGGHPQAATPNIDRLADQGTLFANAHCQAPVCNPSRASMMTGRYPHSTGVYFLSPDLRRAPALAKATTLPEYFANHGYQTMGIGKLFHTNDQRFFQEYGGRGGIVGPRPRKKISQPHGHPLWDWGAFPEQDTEIPDWHYAQWAAKKLQQEYDQPFFLAVGFFRPHVPMYAPASWFNQHPRSKIRLPDIADDDLQDISPYAVNLTTLQHVSPTHAWMKSSGEWDHAVQAYLACISFVDHCVGMVLDGLESGPNASNTLVILFSDHGFHLGEKNHWAKRTLWEDGTRVPLILSTPGAHTGQVCKRPVELIDVFPTLLDLTNLPDDPKQEGQSLRPLLANPDADWTHPAITSFGPGNYSVRSTRYRYIQYLDGSREFYDHQSDENEWNNRIDDPSLAEVIQQHAIHIPKKPHALLAGDSTGHKAYAAANERWKALKPRAEPQKHPDSAPVPPAHDK